MGNNSIDTKKAVPESIAEVARSDPTDATAPAANPNPKLEPALNDDKRLSIGAKPHLAFEPNPFEHSFATTGVQPETPGGTKLPSVAALTSPAPLLPGGGTTPFAWGGSLRTGPLSPAMLSGPTNDYFGDSAHLRGGFPTPNESSLRTGLTPGGGGSMFPVPSPGGAALFLQSGGATPSTVDFHRTALSAAAAAKRIDPLMHQSITSQPQDMLNGIGTRPMETTQPVEAPGQHDANDAANGLFMLASQSRTGSQPAQYTMPHPQPVHAHSHVNNAMMGGQSADTSPVTANRNHSISVVSTNSGRGQSEGSDESEHKSRPTTRGRGKKGPAAQTNGRRKTEDGPSSKAPAAKKAKGNSGHAMSVEPEPLSEEEPDLSKDEYNANGKKMTDEEKRKNFLERNRVAALKCRQRKKQWLANLQQKVELYSTENDALSAQIAALREEVVNLKTLLLAHKDCPVTQQQGLSNMHMQLMGEYGNQMQNPYGMGMNGPQIMAGQPMNRRYS